MDMEPAIRKRMKRREGGGDARFITFSCEQRLPLLGNPAIRDLFVRSLAACRARFGFELFAWVVMPEHVHLIVRPRKSDLFARALLFLKLSVAQRVIARWRELGAPILSKITRPDGSPRFWQKGGGFDRNIRHEGEFAREVRYVHRNPVERGLVERPGDWAWSSARWWLDEEPWLIEGDAPPWIPREQMRVYV